MHYPGRSVTCVDCGLNRFSNKVIIRTGYLVCVKTETKIARKDVLTMQYHACHNVI